MLRAEAIVSFKQNIKVMVVKTMHLKFYHLSKDFISSLGYESWAGG
jgi:hypothetical protein